MLTLGTLLKATDQSFLNTGKYKPEGYSVKKSKDEKGEHLKYTAKIIGGKDVRTSYIKCYAHTINHTAPCEVYCSCNTFTYKLELALAARGSAVNRKAKQQMPTKTNPAFLPGLCPHLVLLVKIAMSTQDSQTAIANALNHKIK